MTGVSYVEFADVLEVLVECLDQVVDELQVGQFVLVLLVHRHDQVQTSVPSIDDLVLQVVEEETLTLLPTETLPDQFPLESHPFLGLQEGVVLCQTSLALFVDHEYELDHL